MKDAVHNQVSAGLLPGIAAYRAKLPPGALRDQVDDLIREIQKLTVLDETALAPQVSAIEAKDVRDVLTALVPSKDTPPVDALAVLGKLMANARGTIIAGRVSDADARRLVDLAITAAQVMQQRGSTLLADPTVTA